MKWPTAAKSAPGRNPRQIRVGDIEAGTMAFRRPVQRDFDYRDKNAEPIVYFEFHYCGTSERRDTNFHVANARRCLARVFSIFQPEEESEQKIIFSKPNT